MTYDIAEKELRRLQRLADKTDYSIDSDCNYIMACHILTEADYFSGREEMEELDAILFLELRDMVQSKIFGDKTIL